MDESLMSRIEASFGVKRSELDHQECINTRADLGMYEFKVLCRDLGNVMLDMLMHPCTERIDLEDADFVIYYLDKAFTGDEFVAALKEKLWSAFTAEQCRAIAAWLDAVKGLPCYEDVGDQLARATRYWRERGG